MAALAPLTPVILYTFARTEKQPEGQKYLSFVNVHRRLNLSANEIALISLNARKRRNDMVLFLFVYFSIICCVQEKNSVYI